MEDRPYANLKWFPINDRDPRVRHQKEGQRAVELAYSNEIQQITKYLSNQQSVLVITNKSLAHYLEQCLEKNLSTVNWVQITCHGRAATTPGGPPLQQRSALQFLLQELETQLTAAISTRPAPVLVLRHMDLMAWTAGDRPSGHLNEILYWLTEYTEVVKLVFWDPVYTLPKVIEDLFPNRVSLQIFSREVLWQLVSSHEARKISPSPESFDIRAQLTLYQYVSGSTVPEIRRALRSMAEQNYSDCVRPEDGERAFNHIRQQISAGAVQSTFDWAQPAGYQSLKNELTRKIVFPFDQRNKVRTGNVLEQFDAIIPRGVILYGPPGTGKTEWAKWLASELKLTLLVVHGPELKHSLAGETEAAIRRLFARARREAPSLILIDELDALTPSRTAIQSEYGASMVAQFLTEMDGLHKDEAVLVLGTTNRLDAVDHAFQRPGRFGEAIEVGYPQREDRAAILWRYNENLKLGLTPASVEWLVDETEGPLDPEGDAAQKKFHDAYVTHYVNASFRADAGVALEQQLAERWGTTQSQQFSGDHVRAICLYLLRESLYRGYADGSKINDPIFLREAVDAVRKRQVSPAISGSANAPEQDVVWGTNQFSRI